MNYSLDKFLRPLNETDKIVTVFNNLNKPAYTINPVSVSRLYVSSNLLKINLTKNNAVIILDFSDNSDAKQALQRLQAQFNLIKNKLIAVEKEKETAISQVQDSVDFSGVYETILSGGTFSSPTASGTASTVNSLESRLFSLIQKIGTDVINIKGKQILKITDSFSPSSYFSDEIVEHLDVLDVQFDFDSLGDVTIYINSMLLVPGESDDSISYFSDGSTIKNKIFNNSRLFINPSLLGYSIDPTDSISIEYLKQTS